MKAECRKTLYAVLALTLFLNGCAGSSTDNSDAINNSEPAQSQEEAGKDSATPEINTESYAETDSNTDAGKNESDPSDADAARKIEDELYDIYITINNEMLDSLDTVLVSYFDYVGFQEDFVLLADDYRCLSNSSTFYEDMESANDLLETKTEKDALDNAYAELYPVMNKLAQTLDETAEYTDMKYYLDDDYAKGAEYHADIWETYQQYEPLAAQFIEELSIVADARSSAELEMLKAEGYEATYALVKMISTAQEIQTAIYEQGIDDYDIINLNIETLQPLYGQYVEEVQAILDFMKDESIMSAEGFPVNSTAYPLLEESIRNAKIALTDLFERVKNQEAFTEDELNSASAPDGAIRNFNERLSDVINHYNSLIGY